MFVGAKRYPVEELKLGMFVCELDRPWTDTPFLYQGFFVDTEEQLAEIRKYCQFVFVDEFRQRESESGIRHMAAPGKQKPAQRARGRVNKSTQPDEVRAEVYPVRHTVELELDAAREARQATEGAYQGIITDVMRKKVPVLTRMREAVGGMVESVVRNPNAMVWLTRLKNLDTYTYSHAIDVCAFLLVFGRHLGLPKEDLRVLGLGGILLDVGKSKLPLPLLQKRTELTQNEYGMVRSHVELGIGIISAMEHVPERAKEMVQHHHERFDGSGYPFQLAGNHIGIYARMAAIVDTFDAITSDRPYAKALSSHEALRKLYSWAGSLFHKGLVEQFIECLGIYPVGTMVELNTGEVGIVLAQNRFRQLRPKLVLILDREKRPYGTMDILDLIEEPVDENDVPVEILRALEPGMYGVDPRQYYI